MALCSTCSAPAAEGARFCSACGTALDIADTPTGTTPQRGRQARPASGSASAGSASASTPSPDGGRFVPGTLLADRYRVVGLLGRGGMGEVYRAEDLKLGQSVALKFLPEGLASDADRLRRFYDEVRIARQISHPAVCRVHDVGEAEGQPFLTMEYVDGESLASLLRRIGRLPADKALEIARQVAAGLGAAHARGVLHRDLKPDNVMIDGQGKARITDFGLAAVADAVSGAEVRSGTPAYMSPEQLTGREVSVRSDVYALGLLLFELLTGRRAFRGRSLIELTRQHCEEPPDSPSALVSDVDPALERLVLRCLEKDPQRRPASALAVLAALPGGDPLAAALAAGETPSPELVAAAGASEAVPVRWAWAGLVVALVSIVATPHLARQMHFSNRVGLEKPPAVLQDRARELLRRLGHGEAAVDWASGYAWDADYVRHVERTDPAPDRWDRSGEGAAILQLWYRESPRPLVSYRLSGRVHHDQPPAEISGMATVKLDMQGRLVALTAVPPQLDQEDPSPERPDWDVLLDAAGLDAAALTPTTPRWTPPVYADARAAWDGSYPGSDSLTVRVEAAAYRGRPVYFALVGQWSRPERMQKFEWSRAEQIAVRIAQTLLLVVMGAALLLARRNLRRGRGDRAGARRISAFVLALSVASWALEAHHVSELGLIVRGAGAVLLVSGCVFVLYLALEPFVRRRWPQMLVSWARVLSGRLRDPLVGRDLLAGSVLGGLIGVSAPLLMRLPGWLGRPGPTPSSFNLDALMGLRPSLVHVLDFAASSVLTGMGLLLLMVLLRVALRRELLAALALASLLAVQQTLVWERVFLVMFLANLVLFALPVFVMLRFGLLALVVGLFEINLLLNLPLNPSPDHWAYHTTLLVMAVCGGLAVWGLHASRAGRPWLGGWLSED